MTEKVKYSTLVFDKDVRIDIKQVLDGSKLKQFAINVSTLIGDKRHDVFRVDTAHGYLHQQRLWISNKPEKLQSKPKKNYKGDFGYWKDTVSRNYTQYVKAYKESITKHKQ